MLATPTRRHDIRHLCQGLGHSHGQPHRPIGLGSCLIRSAPTRVRRSVITSRTSSHPRHKSLAFGKTKDMDALHPCLLFYARSKGLEPSTSRVTGGCSNQLSYDRIKWSCCFVKLIKLISAYRRVLAT